MQNGFLFTPTPSRSRMGILNIHGCRGPNSGSKTTSDTPKVAAFCSVRLTILVCDPSIKISSCRMFYLLITTSSKSRLDILHAHGHRGPHGSPKTTRDTPKVAAFCFVCLMILVYDSLMRISSCKTVFCFYPPHLSLGWINCTPTAIGAPKAALKQPELPLRSLHLALSALQC